MKRPLSRLGQELIGIARAMNAVQRASLPTRPVDPRDPDHSREGMFVYHNCYRCDSGAQPCVNGSPNGCEYLRARND